MNDDEIKMMILNIVQEIDYDIYKDFMPECSEDPDGIEERMESLVEIVKKHLK